MKKREQTKYNDILFKWKYKSLLFLFAIGACFTVAASSITNLFRDQEPNVNEVLEEYLSTSFTSNINNLYVYNIDKPMEDFMNSSTVTSFFFCSDTYPAADDLITYLSDSLTNIAERSEYITAAAVYASSSNTIVTSQTEKIDNTDLHTLLKDLVYTYNSNSVDKNSLHSEGYNTFLFKYEEYVVFSKDLTTLSGSSYATLFYLMDAEAFSAFVYSANGMIPYKVSIYDAHNTLLFSNSSRTVKENYSQLVHFTTKSQDSGQTDASDYIYCTSDITGLQYLLEMEQLPLSEEGGRSPFVYPALFAGALLLTLAAALFLKYRYKKAAVNALHIIQQLDSATPKSIQAFAEQIDQKISSLTTENNTMKDIIHATSSEALSHLFAKIIIGKSIEPEETQLTLSNTGYDFQPDDLYVAGILHQTTAEFISADERYKTLNMLNSVFEKFKEKHPCNLCAFLYDEKSFVIIASFPSGTSIAKGKTQINDLTLQINEGISFLRVPMAAAFGHMYNSILDLSFSYNEAFKSMHYQTEAQTNGLSTNTPVVSHSFPSIPLPLPPNAFPNDSEEPTMDSLAPKASEQNTPSDSSQIPKHVPSSSAADISGSEEVSVNSDSKAAPTDTVERIERRAAQIAQLIWENREEGLSSLIDRTVQTIFEGNELTAQEELSRRLISTVTSHMLSYPFVNDHHLSNVYDDISITIQDGTNSEELQESLLTALRTLCRDFSEALKKQRNPYITAAQKYIETNYSNSDLSLEEIAENLKIAPNYLSTIFSKNLGIKLFEYVNEYRLEKSIEMLLHTNKTVNDISTECGFGSSRNYIRIFKKYKDNTPGAYRKQHTMQP